MESEGQEAEKLPPSSLSQKQRERGELVVIWVGPPGLPVPGSELGSGRRKKSPSQN